MIRITAKGELAIEKAKDPGKSKRGEVLSRLYEIKDGVEIEDLLHDKQLGMKELELNTAIQVLLRGGLVEEVAE